jgi:uncharacterized protein
VRIELGSAWQHQYDTEMKTVIDTLITPEFKRGDYSRGIVDGVRGMNNVVRGLDLPKPNVPWWRWAMLVLGIVAGISAIVSLFRAGRRGWAWLLLAALGGLLLSLFIPRSGNWGSDNDDGGSSDGFGGGDSDGGGASGDW